MSEAALKAAFNLFNPGHPLENGELDTFYVSRPHAPLSRLRAWLETTNEPATVLFSGHRGSGKSTELRRLAKDLEASFFVAQISTTRFTNIADLSYVDVVLAAAAGLLRKALDNEEYVPLHDDLLKEILRFLEAEITHEAITATTGPGNVTGKLNALLVSIEAKYGKENTTRTTIRDRLYPRVASLIERINDACKNISEQTGRTPLIIVEDIDKSDLAHARDLFFNHATTLNSLGCHVIYTFPVPLCYSNEFPERVGDYTTHFLLPNVSLYTRDDRPEPDGYKTLKEVITRRVPETLFAADALEKVIQLSGGLMRNLIRFVRDAALIAITENASAIRPEMVEEVAAEAGNGYRRLLLPEHYDALIKAHATKQIIPNETVRQLLENLSLLEYRNSENWCDVQPVVQRLLPSHEP
jgi:DNA polymerase III delta prime subunit